MSALLSPVLLPLRSDRLIGRDNESNRRKWLADALARLPSGLRLLDAGAGELSNKPFCRHLEYVSQDFCQYDGSGNQKALQTKDWDTSQVDIVSDITSIPVPDQSFDAVLCSEVIEHIAHPVKALEEFARILRPGGTLILTAPFASLTHFAPFHFCTGFNSYFYEHHLSRLGFEVKEIARNGDYFECIAQEIHRLPEISKRYSNYEFGFLGKLILKLTLKVLYTLSRRDTNSDELLCHGYHVMAVKK